MKPRMTKVTAMVAVLLLGLFAAPAAAQQVGDTIEVDVEVDGEQIEGVTALQCSVGVARANADLNPAVFADVFVGFFPDFDGDKLEMGEVAVGQEQTLVDDTVAFLGEQGQTLTDVCSIYIVDVLPEPVIPDPDPVDDPIEEPEPEILQRTGADAFLMAILGATMLGLGAVAVRRTREDDTPA